MNKIVFKLTTAVSTAVLLTGSVASVAFGTTDVTVTGNGADSNNTANVNVTSSTALSQSNTANIQNNVQILSNSGNNTANKNTGGDTSISTGDANVSSSVSNSANSNVASVGCNCTGDTMVKIAGNGADSDNKAKVDVSNTTAVSQTNDATVKNNVSVDSNTGDNKANKNTGGDVDIMTGDASVDSSITNQVNRNIAQIGGGSGNGGTLSAEISGNGADSDNTLNLDVDTTVAVAQKNDANIKNDVDVLANSGSNKANKNTGGDTSIDTGDSDVSVDVTNRANSNALDLSACDCVVDGTIKIAGNGADSKNKADVDLTTEVAASQDNDFSCGGGSGVWDLIWSGSGKCNDIHVDSNTGDNKANEDTIHSGDPMITSGDAGGDITVDTTANSNVLGNMGGDLTLPGFPNVHDLNGLLVLLMGMFHSS